MFSKVAVFCVKGAEADCWMFFKGVEADCLFLFKGVEADSLIFQMCRGRLHDCFKCVEAACLFFKGVDLAFPYSLQRVGNAMSTPLKK